MIAELFRYFIIGVAIILISRGLWLFFKLLTGYGKIMEITDTERLDWMEKNGVGLWVARKRTTQPGIAVHNSIGRDGYKTAREAIDAAMKEFGDND